MADSIELSAEFDTKQIKDLLSNLKKKVDQIEKRDKKFIDLLSTVVFQDVMKHFDDETGSTGPWKKWSPSYATYMANLGKGSNKILQDSGRLRQSFQPTNYRVTRDGILWFNPAKTSKGFPYAYAHDMGGNQLPKRDFMWLSSEATVKFEDLLVKFLES